MTVKRLLIAVVLLALPAAGAGLWWWLRGSLPSLDGEWALSGLHGPVEIVSDAHGVPHVYARDSDDAWFAAGALHARDRLWQMELYRRATTGRLAEVLGEHGAADRSADAHAGHPRGRRRGVRPPRCGRRAWRSTRYADGVNAALARCRAGAVRLELQLLGITPAAWTPQDSLAVGRLLAFRLAENLGGELVRHALTRTLGPAAASQLAGRYPDSGPTVLGELGAPTPGPPAFRAAPPRLRSRRHRRRRPTAMPWGGPNGRSTRPRWPGSIRARRAPTATPGSSRVRARQPAGRSWPTIRTC